MAKIIGRLEEIKDHFEKEAKVFDTLFFKVMPEYSRMMAAVADSLPFARSAPLEVVDLGCGTGNLTLRLLESFPKARVSCVDMAENMLIMAKAKLVNRGVRFWQGDIREFKYAGNYDAVVSSLVLHHIEQGDKPAFYRKLFAALKPGGVFVNIDMVLSSSPYLQRMFMEKWKEFMKASGLPPEKIKAMITRHRREDRPAILEDELAMLRRAGFRDVDVVVKRYNFAVYGGTK